MAKIRWFACMLKSHRSLCVSFSRTAAGLCTYYLLVWSNCMLLLLLLIIIIIIIVIIINIIIIARGVMIIVVENGHGDTSPNPGQDWLHFTKH